MSDSEKGQRKKSTRGPGRKKSVTLKDLSRHLSLSTATISLVLNRSPVADAIPAETQERVFAAAKELKYRPNHLARSLRSQRSRTIGVLVPEIVEPYAAAVMSGIESHLLQEGYFYLVASHRQEKALVDEYMDLFEGRSVEGMILLATTLEQPPSLPTVIVAGHDHVEGVTHVVLDHDHAADLALAHLTSLGHRRIALFKGQPGNADTEDRWRGIREQAAALGIEIHPELTFQLMGGPTGALSRTEQTYTEGYDFGRELLGRGADFTALFAFNDVSAIGACRAFVEAGLRIPDDVSVIGFDDIISAAFHNPGLTTVRQPLREMGLTAGKILLEQIERPGTAAPSRTIEPDLVVRGTTGPPRKGRRRA